MIQLFNTIIIFAVLSNTSVFAQKKLINADKFGNLYFVENNQLVKRDTLLNKLCSFSDGNINSDITIDANNPLTPIIYKPTTRKIIWLDKYCTEISSLSFDNTQLDIAVAFCSSAEQGFWIITSDYFSIIKAENNGSVITKSILPEFFNSLTYSQIAPIMTEANKNIYIYHPDFGLGIFDLYGTFKNVINELDGTDFITGRSTLGIIKDSEIVVIDINTLERNTIQKDSTAKKYFYIKDSLYYIDSKHMIHKIAQ